jgi:branched-chain amino acid transport system substrate-binding protein
MQKTRVRRVGALIVGLSLVAAACGGDDDDDAAGTEAASTEESSATAEESSDMSEEMSEESSDMSEEMSEESSDMSVEMSEEATAPAGAGDGVLRLGGILPETGSLAFLGPPEFAGVQLAVNEINEAGGVLGADVEWLPGDSGDNGEVANATVDRLLAEDVDGFIGAASSGVSLTVIDKITQAGKIHFSPANTSPAFTTYDDNGLYFRTAPSDVVQGAALADIMINDGAASAAFLVRNDSYGTGLQEFTIEPYTAAGGTVVYGETETYDPEAQNFDAEIASVVDANPDAIVIIGFDETAQILQGLIEAGFGPSDKLIYGTDGNMGNALAEQFDDPSVVAGMKGTLPGVDVAGEIADFRDRLLEVDSSLIDYSYSAESYDATVITALAAIVAGSDDGVAVAAEINDVTRGGEKCTTFADCAALAEAGTDLDYDGVSGPLEFIDAGEPSQASILILEFDETGAITVAGSIEGQI